MLAGYCQSSAIPIRAEASHRSEMVSQILFGETYFVLDGTTEWLRVRTCNDDYEGWIHLKQHYAISDEALSDYMDCEKIRLRVPLLTGQPTILTMGALVPVHPKLSPCPWALPEEIKMDDWYLDASTSKFSRENRMTMLIHAAFSMLKVPYLWGGRTPLGIDCSGFTQLLYSLIGVQLPRDASQQVQRGEPLDFIQEAQCGDLAFFHNDVGRIVHVGIMCNDHLIIHSSGSVRMDDVDENGIYDSVSQRYTHKLRVIKRIV